MLQDSSSNTNIFIPQFPYHMVWLATNACNARCIHCSTAATKRLQKELTTIEAKNLFSDFVRLGVFDVAISGGEPLARPDIFEIIEHGQNLGINIGIGSNGSTITNDVIHQLKSINVNRLQISIDGLEKMHDQVRCWSGLYQKSSKAIQMGLVNDLNVHVCFTAHRINYTQLEDVIEQCIKWGVKRFNLSRFVPTGRGDKELDLSPSEWKKITQSFLNKRDKYIHEMEFTTHLAQLILNNKYLDSIIGFIGCQAGIGQGCVGPCGDVSPCVMLPIIIGNIRVKSFAQIWQTSPIINKLKQRTNLKGQCQSCHFREKCGGCRAIAFSYTNDFMATDTRCWLKKNMVM